MLDITKATIAKSDQMNAADIIGEGQTFTITNVTPGNADQPWNYHLAEFPQPFKPSKTVLRIFKALWGSNAEVHIGRRLTLYCDPTVRWAGEEVGGIRVSHMSHISKPAVLKLPVSKTKKVAVTIQPLPDEAPAPDYQALLTDATTPDECAAIGNQAHAAGHLTDQLRAAVTKRIEEVSA